MSIFVTGDCHREFTRFNMLYFPRQKELTKDDYVIIAGDFGGLWDNSAEGRWWLNWLTEKSFRVLFIDGNHENFNTLNSLPVKEWKGGKVHPVPGTDILHLMRGQMYDIDGCKIFTFGGAASHDISEGIIPYDTKGQWRKTEKQWERQGKRFFRIDQVSWWKEEMPNEEEMSEGIETMERNDWKCDYIITHDCPTSDLVMLYAKGAEKNALTDYLEMIRSRAEFKRWYFGHHHDDRAINDKEIMLYFNVVQIW